MRSLVVCLLLIGCGRLGFGDGDPVDASGGILPIEIAPPAFTTSSPVYEDVAGGTLTIPPSPGTTWLLLTSATLASTGTSAVNVEARYLIDGVERGVGATQVTAGAGPWQHFYVFDGSDAEQSVIYQLRDIVAATSTIDQLHAVAVPLPAGAEPHYASADATQAVTALAPAPLLSLSLGPLDGDYVVLAVVNGTELPATANLWLEWFGPSGEELLERTQFPREPRQSWFTARVLFVSSPDAKLTLEAYSGTGDAQVSYVRAFAMRADAFASIEHQLTTTQITTISPNVSVGSQITPRAGDAARYLYLATSWAQEDCPNTIDALRRLHFIIDAEDRVTEHATENCAYQATYGTVGLLPTRPSALATGVSSGNGQPVVMRASQIVLLGL